MNYFLQIIPDSMHGIEFLGNTITEYIIFTILFLLAVCVFRVFHYTALWRLEMFSKQTNNDVDDLFISILKTVTWLFYVYVSFWISLIFLTVPDLIQQTVDSILIILVVYQVVCAVGLIVEYSVSKQFTGVPEGQSEAIIDLLTKLIKGVLWVIGFLFVLQNLGIDVTSLIAGLGIGGIAIALALQNILSDLFSSFSIYFDKPFVVGDFIAIGELMGTVEDIGIKTTRLRALSGEEIILANRELTTARIQNFRNTTEWRGTFSVGVAYDTDSKTLDAIKQILQEIVENKENVRFDRANLTYFAESSINYDVVLYSQTRDYNTHLANIHSILTSVKERFDAENISIAFPTRTVYIHNS